MTGESLMSHHRQKRQAKKVPNRSSLARKEYKDVGIFNTVDNIYRSISADVYKGRFDSAAHRVVTLILWHKKEYYNCLYAVFSYATYIEQIIIWREISRYVTINYCGVDEYAQDELIKRKLATPASFECQKLRRQMPGQRCMYCDNIIEISDTRC